MQTTACPASGQKRKEGLGLDVKGGEVKVRTTNWCGCYLRPTRLAKDRKKSQKEQRPRQHRRHFELAKEK